MGETVDFWQAIAPYWYYIEDNALDLDSIRSLLPEIAEKVLVVGTGHGLLMEELQKNGLQVDGVDTSPHMIKQAKERRNLDVKLVDGTHLPFEDGAHATSILATGVVDFMDDESQIASLLLEVFRVTEEAGGVLVAFGRYHPKVEELMTFLGLLHPDGIFFFRDSYKIVTLSPLALISYVRKRTNVGLLRALLTMAKMQLFLPRKEKKMSKNFRKVIRLAERDLGSIDGFIDSAPEQVPYRNEEKIRTLFCNLGLRIDKFISFDTCYVVKLVPNQQGT